MTDDVIFGISGELMEDTDTAGKRKYLNLSITAKLGSDPGAEPFACGHLIAYAPSAKSRASRTQLKWHENAEKCNTSRVKRRDDKLKRDRVIAETLLEAPESFDELEKFLGRDEFRISMVDARKVVMSFKTKFHEFTADAGKSFEEKMEEKLTEIEDPGRAEESRGIGTETAKINPNWGMF